MLHPINPFFTVLFFIGRLLFWLVMYLDYITILGAVFGTRSCDFVNHFSWASHRFCIVIIFNYLFLYIYSATSDAIECHNPFIFIPPSPY